ncbi:hypothetical protein ATG66_0940 [Vibrio sp. ES.051]|uniref:hypothetical protein n=1 Tax=Vibrio sp. ES.051 TaxID=1761909 RepID=UPI000BF73FDD|nr:hypothetical protein [Vibrio sp. ES.051]PFG58390.1 hypothetical protein ATG66_0940 [Vibrio sp. ES.051]
MSRHCAVFLSVFCFLIINPSLAMDAWWQSTLSELPFNKLKNVIHTEGTWYQCDTGQNVMANTERVRSYCLDDFQYYHQHLYGELSLHTERARFSFLTEYQWHKLNDLILNLRKDGLVLRSVVMEEERYDVVAALEKKTTEEVDKDVILLMNRYPPEATQTMFWVRANEFEMPSPNLEVVLRSDGEMIELQVIRF